MILDVGKDLRERLVYAPQGNGFTAGAAGQKETGRAAFAARPARKALGWQISCLS
jgi:hypothetical protein